MEKLKLVILKMFADSSNLKINSRAFTDLIIKGAKEVEKTYGPVYTVRYIKYALEFEAKKIGEKPAEDIKTLDQLVEYLVSKSDKYPDYQNTVSYARIKAENELQGQSGAGTQITLMTFTRKVFEAQKVKERNIDIDAALSKFYNTLLSIKIFPEQWRYKKNEDGSVDILGINCPLLDACNLSLDEGIVKRIGDTQRCAAATFYSQFISFITGYEWDYKVLDSLKRYGNSEPLSETYPFRTHTA